VGSEGGSCFLSVNSYHHNLEEEEEEDGFIKYIDGV
jgi:hypothetical protein